jgi:F0F1-type ATP synthase epsilon subunit
MTYHYKTNNDNDPRLYGFIAQDVEKIFPEFVSVAENGFKGIAYSNFSVVAIQAIQEQQMQIDELKKDNEELKKIMQSQMMITEELKKEIELLKKESRVAGK